jgi:hypothetical protein
MSRILDVTWIFKHTGCVKSMAVNAAFMVLASVGSIAAAGRSTATRIIKSLSRMVVPVQSRVASVSPQERECADNTT